jgi:hypothetical protein
MGVVNLVLGAGQITPDGGQYEKDLPIYITVEGLTADTRYTVYEVQDGTATLVLNITSSTAGKLTFSTTFSETGEGRIEVRDITGVTVDSSANYLIVDSFNDQILPVLIFAATISIGVAVVMLIVGRIAGKI